MANLNFIPRKMNNTKLKLSDLNPHLMCVLCGGYYIDATTIVECLHSFCRSCIVKHLESSKYCPICEVQVHKTKPLMNIRPDKTLQDIVYKLVPGLFANEMRNRRRFYRERPHYIKPNDSESSGEVSGERKIYINDENITFSLVYHKGSGPTSVEDSYREFPAPANNERRYFKCPTGVTIQHLKKLIRAKYELNDNNYKLEVYFRDQDLHEDLTLLDVAYIYLWKTKGTLDLTYKIFENVVKRQKIEEKPEEVRETPKEVEVNIGNGKLIGKETKEEKEEEKEKEKDKDKDKDKVKDKVEIEIEIEKEKEKEKEKEAKKEEVVKEEKTPKESEKETEEKAEIVKPETAKPPVAPQTKENGVPGAGAKEVQLQISESGVMRISQVEDSQIIVKTVEETKAAKNKLVTVVPVKETKPGNGVVKPPEKKPSNKPLKPYKTINCSPKVWNPVIPKEKLRPTLMKNPDEPRKPSKFFKMRNLPRFLGNPSSGVKPMFAGTPEKPEEKKSETVKTVHKILKIDPKTLRPIDKDELKIISSTPSAPNLLTNPFIPNNNHFLFSDLHLLPPPATGSFKDKPVTATGFKAPIPNGNFPPICFPAPEHSPPGFYPFGNLAKPQTFPFPPGDKMDPLHRASRLSPFGNLAGLNVAGFHASLPPSISRLLNPHHHFRKISQSLEKKNKDESTKETSKQRCDDSLKVNKEKDRDGEETTGEEGKRNDETTTANAKKDGVEQKKEVNGEICESASESKGGCNDSEEQKEKEKESETGNDNEKDKDKDR